MKGIFIKSFQFLLRVSGVLAGVLVLVITIRYITCPVYEFRAGQPFSGGRLFNPYEGMDMTLWKKGNFQVQSYAWGGLTDGWNNSNERIWDTYGRLGYDIIGISDYQKINRYGQGRPGYVPVYEHGYSIRKVHQVVIGAGEVLWLDYPVFQDQHNKQKVISKLKEDSSLIFLAHPLLRKGYSFEEMKILGGYDGIEVLTNSWNSLDHWDTALSSGNYVTILANDDAHDINNPEEVGQQCTFVHTASLEENDILMAFRKARTYGVQIGRQPGEGLDEKIVRTRALPMLTRHDLDGNTLHVACDSVARFIRFIGQGGEGLQTDYRTNEARYVFRPEDTYIRAEIHMENGTALYMNPVCRHDGTGPSKIPVPEADLTNTWFRRVIGFSILLGAATALAMTFRRQKKRNRPENTAVPGKG